MRVYVDGSALTRYLDDVRGSAQFRAWAQPIEPDLLVSVVSRAELRIATLHTTSAQRVRARDDLDRIEVLRLSDQALGWATNVTGVLSPFAAVHLGMAMTHRDVGAVATYHGRLARLAALHGLQVVSPGLPDGWWEQHAPPTQPRVPVPAGGPEPTRPG
ncbi:PIN domain-containing protein [Cellulomonas timonensis]|uniref:PIN domain-containing protein n=1 Tax=Cellulomonas timonensis TaxID=1689271 RepID=UPI00082D4E8A|nr:PIN domain-containing protein [Cellulomonas timonensis]